MLQGDTKEIVFSHSNIPNYLHGDYTANGLIRIDIYMDAETGKCFSKYIFTDKETFDVKYYRKRMNH